jgi:hypothetical protein
MKSWPCFVQLHLNKLETPKFVNLSYEPGKEVGYTNEWKKPVGY